MLMTLGGLLLVGAGCFGSSTATVSKGSPPPTEPPPAAAGANVQLGVNAGAALGEVREVMITAKQFSFEPAEVRVKVGERIRLVVKSPDTTHGLAIPAFNVNMTIEQGQSATAEFTADKAGTYPFFCSVFCGSGHGGMKGSLIVE